MVTPSTLQNVLTTLTMPAAPELTIQESDGRIRCLACGHRCRIGEGRAGICRVRFRAQGELRVPAGYVAGLQVDPVEKKPFFHVYPGREALSFGMLGCDFHCSYCQNWVTSQALRDEEAIAAPLSCTPRQLVARALEFDAPLVISTYNEPLITTEWAVAVFKEARRQGLRCGYVSNGNATPEVLAYLKPYVDLYKVDLKSFQDKHYRTLGGVLANVLETIRNLHAMGFWVEIVTLVVPGFNDGDDELRAMARFIAEVSPDIPWHVTAFHPDYKMTEPPRTGTEHLLRAYEAGKDAGLHFVYAGNLPGSVGDRESTFCPSCHRRLVHRRGFVVLENRMSGSTCPDCGTTIPGLWEDAPPRRTVGSGMPRPLRVDR